jgi:hypothetical protein
MPRNPTLRGFPDKVEGEAAGIKIETGRLNRDEKSLIT